MPVEPWPPAAVLAVEASFGYPQALYARISHPVVWIGKLIEALERRWTLRIYLRSCALLWALALALAVGVT